MKGQRVEDGLIKVGRTKYWMRDVNTVEFRNFAGRCFIAVLYFAGYVRSLCMRTLSQRWKINLKLSQFERDSDMGKFIETRKH